MLITSIEYKIMRVECLMPKQSDITSKHKIDLLHKNFIHYKFVSYGKREACHTHQVNVASGVISAKLEMFG